MCNEEKLANRVIFKDSISMDKEILSIEVISKTLLIKTCPIEGYIK